MIHEPTKHMIPPKRNDSKKYTVVLDLDETLIYAREGPLYARPHLDELLEFLGRNCETVVWTAGVRAYAQAVIRNIDPNGVIDHCIYRHEKWFTGQAGYSKDLALVGRDLGYVMIIENTPDCIRGHEENGILVSDYEGGETADPTLPAITKLVDDLVRSNLSVPEFLKRCSLLSRQYVPTDLGDKLYVYCLDPAKASEARYNRDLQRR
jgi:RNA polymerase II subunit A small phosphatase-like protein